MPKRDECAINLWAKYREQGYPEEISREKAATIMGISQYNVRAHIANGSLKIDKLTNKVKLYSIAKFMCG